MSRGLFISVEGTDGSGKTTQLGLIRKYLEDMNREVVFLREPGGTRISEKIRSIVLDPDLTEMGNTAEMLLYAAARAQLAAEVIKPALDGGRIVVCDRFVDSTYAYQGYGREMDMGILEAVNNAAIDGLMPDMTLFFDVSPEVALERRIATSSTDRIENEKARFHRKVYEGYLQLAARYPERIRRVDGSRSVELVWSDVKKLLDSLLI